MRVVVANHITLDGVLQAPARADEDTRGAFAHGGWAVPGSHEALDRAFGERLGVPGSAFLLGRRSYEDILGWWNVQGGRYKDSLNAAAKYVASSSPDTRLPWPNSTLLHTDVPAAVAELKRQPGGNLVITGSGQLIRSLLPHGLIDEFLLMIHPVVLGSGLRLFHGDGQRLALRLADTASTSTGVIVATYHPA